MHPVLLKIGSLEFHAYTTLISIAFLTAILLSVREGERHRPPILFQPTIGIWIFFAAMIGAKAWWIIQYDDWHNVWQAYRIWQGGLVFFGGLVGGVIAGAIYLSINRVPLAPCADIAAVYVPLAHGITRLGCFLNGCCWGHPTDVPWAVRFPQDSFAFERQVEDGLLDPLAQASLPVHPVQIYFIIGLLATAAFLKYRLYRKPFHGAVVIQYFIIQGAFRYFMETFRGDSARELLGMSSSQTVALFLCLTGILCYVLIRFVACRPWASEPQAEH